MEKEQKINFPQNSFLDNNIKLPTSKALLRVLLKTTSNFSLEKKCNIFEEILKWNIPIKPYKKELSMLFGEDFDNIKYMLHIPFELAVKLFYHSLHPKLRGKNVSFKKIDELFKSELKRHFKPYDRKEIIDDIILQALKELGIDMEEEYEKDYIQKVKEIGFEAMLYIKDNEWKIFILENYYDRFKKLLNEKKGEENIGEKIVEYMGNQIFFIEFLKESEYSWNEKYAYNNLIDFAKKKYGLEVIEIFGQNKSIYSVFADKKKIGKICFYDRTR